MSQSKSALVKAFTGALDAGTFLTPKHDPNGGVVYARFRTVLSQEVSGSLDTMIRNGEFEADEYEDSNKRPYYTVTPYQAYSSLGSHIPSGSLAVTGSYDTLVVVSGSMQGWHVFAEDARTISTRRTSGDLRYIGKVK